MSFFGLFLCFLPALKFEQLIGFEIMHGLHIKLIDELDLFCKWKGLEKDSLSQVSNSLQQVGYWCVRCWKFFRQGTRIKVEIQAKGTVS